MFNRTFHWLLISCLVVGGFDSYVLNAAQDVLFEDDFSELDGSFAPTANWRVSVEDKNLVSEIDKDWFRRHLYQSSFFQDFDYSIRIKLDSPDAESGGRFGICFWGSDYTQMYAFGISDAGTVGLTFVGPNTYSPFSWRQSSALKTGSDDWNELRVVAVGNRAAVFLNGKKLTTFKGKPPQGGSLVGLFFEGGKENSGARFSNLKVLAPSAEDAKLLEEKSDDKTDANLIYADDFSSLDPSWGQPSGKIAVKNKTLIFKPEENQSVRPFYEGQLVEDIDASVKVKTVPYAKDAFCYAGINFWITSGFDFYEFYITSGGQAGIAHYFNGRWMQPFSVRAVPEQAKIKIGEANELRVVTNGPTATFSINGFEIGTVKARLPKGEKKFGLVSYAGQGEFQAMTVRKPQHAKPIVDDASDPALIYSDDFAELNPAWGAKSEVLSVNNGSLVIKPPENMIFRFFQGNELADEIDARVKLKLTDDDADTPGDAGLVFWGTSDDDYYMMNVSNKGKVWVSHKIGGKWLTPLASREISAKAKFKSGDFNELKVVTNGKKASFSINGVSVGAINAGAPVKAPWQFGVDAETYTKPSVAEFQSLIVKKPQPPAK